MLSVFCSPSRYVQGRDATEHLGEQMRASGLRGPAFILASRRAAGELGTTWEATLGAAGIGYTVARFGGECSREEIEARTAEARAADARVVIGAGGGKALDTARAVAANLGVPVVNCPTLASSDAPCSALSVLYTPDGVFAGVEFYPRNPELVLVDTSVVARAPKRYLVSGMGDALATWFEARTVIEARRPNTVKGATTISARALAHLCYRTLLEDGPDAVTSVEAGSVTPALERIVEANTLLSGLGFESGGLAIAHSVHNGLTALPQTHRYLHGEKVAFGLLVQLIVEGRPSAEIAEVAAFSMRVGLPVSLGEIGLASMTSGEARTVAERTVAKGEVAHNEPFPVTADLIVDGLRAADEYGRSALAG